MTNTKTKLDKTVKFTPVVGSSLIESYARMANDLAVRLNNGSAYIYKNVTDATFNDFLAASSKGKFFGTRIKNKFVAEQAE